MLEYIYDILNYYNNDYDNDNYETNIKKEIFIFDFLTENCIKDINSYRQKKFLINQTNQNYLVGKVSELKKEKNIITFNIEGLIGTISNDLVIVLYNIEQKKPIYAIINNITFNNITFTKIDGQKVIEISENYNNGIINNLLFKHSNFNMKNTINNYWNYSCQIKCQISSDIDLDNNYIILDNEIKQYNKSLFIELIKNSKCI